MIKRGLIAVFFCCLYCYVLNAESFIRVKFNDGTMREFVADDVQSIDVTEGSTRGLIDNHRFVDLGLSVKWSTMEIGAENIYENGDQFAWGETIPYPTENGPSLLPSKKWSEYKFGNPDDGITKYCSDESSGVDDGLTVLQPEDDAATVLWGENWRTPTVDDFDELYSNTSFQTIYNYENSGVDVVILTSLVTGYETNYIVVPLIPSNSCKYLWTANSHSCFNSCFSLVTSASGSIADNFTIGRTIANFIRPVSQSAEVIGDTMFVITFKDKSKVEYISNMVTDISFYESGEENADLNTGVIDGFGYVDLGLSVLWATQNVGASSPVENGDWFTWGDNTPYPANAELTIDDYKFYNKSSEQIIKYCIYPEVGEVDNKIILEPEDDVATQNWSDNWRTPTAEEVNELLENCDLFRIENYLGSGRDGFIFSSRVPGYEGKEIFIPDNFLSADLYVDGKFFHYAFLWTSTVYKYSKSAYVLMYGDNGLTPEVIATGRFNAYPIRPVADK